MQQSWCGGWSELLAWRSRGVVPVIIHRQPCHGRASRGHSARRPPGDAEALLGVVTLEILGLVFDPFRRVLHPMRALMV